MTAPRPAQFNLRSTYARERAQELSRMTGRTATQVVEDALRAYHPPGLNPDVGGLVRRGPLLVRPATGRAFSVEDADAALAAVRERDFDD